MPRHMSFCELYLQLGRAGRKGWHAMVWTVCVTADERFTGQMLALSLDRPCALHAGPGKPDALRNPLHSPDWTAIAARSPVAAFPTEPSMAALRGWWSVAPDAGNTGISHDGFAPMG